MLYATLIVCTYLFLKFIEPILNMILDLIQLKFTDIGTNYQLKSQAKACDFIREYPEAGQDCQEPTELIGFKLPPPVAEFDDEECYEDCKNQIGFLIQK